MFANKTSQPELFVSTRQIAMPRQADYYSKLNPTLDAFDFAKKVRRICKPAYDQSGRGKPGIDPVVFIKMHLIGFLENIPSQRAIAFRCEDSKAIAHFLLYELTESTPDHSRLSVFRKRLSDKMFQSLFDLGLQALQQHGLLRGKNLGIDTSVIEANASLRGLENRNTQEQYWEYVKHIAKEEGIDPNNTEAVRQFDRKRPKKMSNQDGQNPHDPDAKIGPKKDGATDMIYKPEIVADLDTGAIAGAQVIPGDRSDSKDFFCPILEAQENIARARGEAKDTLTTKTVTADKGYFSIDDFKTLHSKGIKTIISDPQANRRLDKLSPEDRQAVKNARRSAKSQYGKRFLKRRGMHLERVFAHLLDNGGQRRTTLRGHHHNNKRFLLGALAYNLSQLMRKLIGIGTPKQWVAAKARGKSPFLAIWVVISMVIHGIRTILPKPNFQLEPEKHFA